MVNLSLKGEGPTGSGYTLSLDGQDISKSTRALSLDMSVEDVTVATIEVYADLVEIDADVEAKVELIHVKGGERTSFASRFREWIRP